MDNVQTIIALSGRKGAGKNTIATFLGGYYAKRHSPVWKQQQGCDPSQYVFECSFADKLKEFCIETLGLTHEQCYGTDDEKNAPTEYDWSLAPKFLQWKFGDAFGRKMVAEGKTHDELMVMYFERMGYRQPSRLVEPRPVQPAYMDGKMTGREIMQIVGTDLNRQTFGNIWAAATLRMIKKQGKKLSLITDNRFPNEIQAVLDQPQGYIIRLTRSPFGLEDAHPSESALDGYDWNNRPKCFVLDNAEMTIEEQAEAVKPIFHQILGA